MRDFQSRRCPLGVCPGLLHAAAQRYSAPPRNLSRSRQRLVNSRKFPNQSDTFGHFRTLSDIKMGKMGNFVFVFGPKSLLCDAKSYTPTLG